MSQEEMSLFLKNSLVLYKTYPAKVVSVGAKIEIVLPDGKEVSVREKDIALVHPGPFQSFDELHTLVNGELEEACLILSGSTVSVTDLAELVYGSYSPATAWEICKLMLDGLYFSGTPTHIIVHSKAEYEKIVAARAHKSADREAYTEFLQRVQKRKIGDDDKQRLIPLEDFALCKVTSCRILKDLSYSETTTKAHALLIDLGIWDISKNPHPLRFGFTPPTDVPEIGLLPSEDRLDLTHLESFAIDDEGNTDPDDAISIDKETLWVHIADVAAIVKPDTPLDIHARGVSSNLYLPEKRYSMLPENATQIFGLGISETSPALSFKITLSEDGSLASYSIHPSTVRVTRTTYTHVQNNICSEPFASMQKFVTRYRNYRKAHNAIFLSFPEVRISAKESMVKITPIPNFESRDLVSEAMLLAGEAAARFAHERSLSFPFSSQPVPEVIDQPVDIASMFAYRKLLKPGIVNVSPNAHAGLGLLSYCRVTSPLRRYLDLVAHQQIRASLSGSTLLNEQEIMNRIGTSAANIGTLNKIERISNHHWKLVYFLQNPSWQGVGIVAEIRDRYAIVLIPSLAFEARVSAAQTLNLNEEILLRVTSVNIPEQSVHFALVNNSIEPVS